jgi:hypothetical protein
LSGEVTFPGDCVFDVLFQGFGVVGDFEFADEGCAESFDGDA